MEKKFKLSENPKLAKIVYAAVIAILSVSAIVIGIVSAANKKPDELPSENPPVSDGTDSGNENEVAPPDEEKKLTFVSPMVGSVTREHSMTEPVFSLTLGEWRVHTGIDISCEEGATVYSSEAGEVTRVYDDPLLGHTVELTHSDGTVTRYSNLDSESTVDLIIGESVKAGAVLGQVGDSSVSELADEPHLHFEMIRDGVKVNPLQYLSDESKDVSLGITE